MVRLILVILYLLIYYVFSLPLFVVAWLIGKKDKFKKAVFSQHWVAFGFHCILFLSGVKLTVRGREHILKNQPALYAFNHRGFFDILAGYVTAPYPAAYVAKKEIQKVPLLARWMRNMNCLFLDRSNIRAGMKTIQEGILLLQEGESVFIAPEGTRNQGNELLEFHEASFKLAQKSKRLIVPVAINNTDAIFEKHFPRIRGGHVIIEYGEPIDMQQMERDEQKHIGAHVRDIISQKVKENEALV